MTQNVSTPDNDDRVGREVWRRWLSEGQAAPRCNSDHAARLGVDIGGTLTDLIVIIDETTGRSTWHRGARPAERLAWGALSRMSRTTKTYGSFSRPAPSREDARNRPNS